MKNSEKVLTIPKVEIAPSCSLLHTPIELALETKLDPRVKDRLAFGVQKLEELTLLGKAMNGARASVAEVLAANVASIAARRASPPVRDPAVRTRLAGVDAGWSVRSAPFAERIAAQRAILNLPPLPTTTISSFPQTADVRKARAAHGKGGTG